MCPARRKISKFFSLLNFFFKNVPGVLKRMQNKGGGDFGVFGAPHAPTRGVWLERSGLAVKSYHPETLAAEEEKINKKIKI